MPFVNSIRKPKVLIFGEINESQDFSSFSKDFDCEVSLHFKYTLTCFFANTL